MISFAIKPLIGVGPIQLHMPRSAVHEVFGNHEWLRNSRESFLGGFRVDYDINELVEFIEISSNEQFIAVFNDANLLTMSADDGIQFVSKFAQYHTSDWELGYSYIFSRFTNELMARNYPGSQSIRG